MLRTTATAAALVMCLLFAACGSNDDSSDPQPAGGGQSSAPAANGQAAATPATAPKTATAKDKAKDSKAKGAAAVKAAEKKVSRAAANRKLRQVSKEAGAKQAAALKAKNAARKRKAKQNIDESVSKLRKQAAALKPKGKPGSSGIVTAVAKFCRTGLADAKNPLKSSAAAKALPSSLGTTIAKLEKAAAENSPYASGTTGDSPARVRTVEILRAMRETLPAAKKYAASPSASNRTALSAGLTNLKNTAYADQIRECALT